MSGGRGPHKVPLNGNRNENYRKGESIVAAHQEPCQAGYGGGCSASSSRGEDPAEDGINLVELAIEVEGAFERTGLEEFRDAFVARHAFAETALGFPCGHSVFLQPLISAVARSARFHQIQ